MVCNYKLLNIASLAANVRQDIEAMEEMIVANLIVKCRNRQVGTVYNRTVTKGKCILSTVHNLLSMYGMLINDIWCHLEALKCMW